MKLADICQINMGQSPDSSTYNKTQDGLPFFQGNADFGEIHPVARIWCNAPVKVANANDILISVRAPIGALNIADSECCIGRGLAALTANQDICKPGYLWYAIASQVNKLVEQGTGTTFKAISKSILEETEVRVPPITEQTHIVSVLDNVNLSIALRKRQLAKLDKLVKARFVEMFGDPENNPFGWEQVTIADVCVSIVRGPFGSALKKEFFVAPDETTYKVYEQKHAIQKSHAIGSYYVTAEKYKELQRFECVAGDILMSCSGTMGELYQLPNGCEKGIINQALCKFTLNDKILAPYFLEYMTHTIGHLKTQGSGIQNIAAVSYVKAMPVLLPPVSAQRNFVHWIEQVEKSRLTIRRGLGKLETLKAALMQEYFG